MSRRGMISLVTLLLLLLIVFFARKEILHAWELIGSLDLWILSLLIPAQIIVYFAGGEMMFSYLRYKKAMRKTSLFMQGRMALELNFVNHILPSGGVSGISYMTWRLGKLGVSPGRATMSQIVRYVAAFLAYLTLLVVSVVFITLDEGVSRPIILVSSILASTIIFFMIFGTYIISSEVRLKNFAGWLTHWGNRAITFFTFGKKKKILQLHAIEEFFKDFHDDYKQLKNDKRILIRPYLWGIFYNVMDVMLFVIGFWALGHTVNPAVIVIAYGIASLAGFFMITPGGAGAYEALMIGFMSSAGIPQGVVIAGVLVTRVVLLLGTIISGYVFYQLTIIKYGKSPTHPN